MDSQGLKRTDSEHLKARIPTSIALNHEDLLVTQYDKYIPTKMDDFIDRMRSINLKRDDTIVIYDNFGIYSAPRMAWTLRYFGAKNVKVLNGGFTKWLKERRNTESGDV